MEVIRYGFGHTSIANLLVASSDGGLVAVIIRERPDHEAMLGELQRRFGDADLIYDEAALRPDIEAIQRFVEHPRGNIEAKLDVRATPFQRRVYDAVLAIPFGRTTTFAQIAREIGSPRAVRAVGGACTRNPLEFAIPCHRVLRSDGKWSGGGEWGDRRQSQIVGRERTAPVRGDRRSSG